MGAATLTIDLDAVSTNWQVLDALSDPAVETAAVVKADGYGLGADTVAKQLQKSGAQSFFVAIAEEGTVVRKALGAGPSIYVFSGMMKTDAALIRDYNLIPLLNSTEQFTEFFTHFRDHPFGIQIDTGMNRLGLEPEAFASIRDKITDACLIMSHLACADEPDHPQNAAQLKCFCDVTAELDAQKSLSATGGILLGSKYHFDLVRPGVGLYGGHPFKAAKPVVQVSLPVIQTRDVSPGESVGYGATWVAKHPSKIATVAAGYADGLLRAMGNSSVKLWAGNQLCPMIGRVSMDLITVDVTDLDHIPDHLDILNTHQTVDDIAAAANTIGYEVLTGLGARYKRAYIGA